MTKFIEANAGATGLCAIEFHPHGIAIRGDVPVGLFSGLSEHFRSDGYTLIDAALCGPLRAAAVLVRSEDDGAAWRAEVDERASEGASGDDELAWLLGSDTGTSSLTIFSVLSDHHGETLARNQRRGDLGNPPWDPDDFGRCYRLLERFPAWRSRLTEVADKHPMWRGLVENWSELEALWREESPSRSCPKLYDRMQELLAR